MKILMKTLKWRQLLSASMEILPLLRGARQWVQCLMNAWNSADWPPWKRAEQFPSLSSICPLLRSKRIAATRKKMDKVSWLKCCMKQSKLFSLLGIPSIHLDTDTPREQAGGRLGGEWGEKVTCWPVWSSPPASPPSSSLTAFCVSMDDGGGRKGSQLILAKPRSQTWELLLIPVSVNSSFQGLSRYQNGQFSSVALLQLKGGKGRRNKKRKGRRKKGVDTQKEKEEKKGSRALTHSYPRLRAV